MIPQIYPKWNFLKIEEIKKNAGENCAEIFEVFFLFAKIFKVNENFIYFLLF